jgi:hypothetical protein
MAGELGADPEALHLHRKDRLRRISPIAVRSGEGRLTTTQSGRFAGEPLTRPKDFRGVLGVTVRLMGDGS